MNNKEVDCQTGGEGICCTEQSTLEMCQWQKVAVFLNEKGVNSLFSEKA